MMGGRIHYRSDWKWKVMLNMIAYSVKDPSTLTASQRYQRLYRACIRRQFLLNNARLKMISNHWRNYYEQVEQVRTEFEQAKSLDATRYDFFVKKYEEWLEVSFFPAVSHWPTRLFSNKYSMNVAWPDQFHEFDPAGYYSPRPISGVSPSAGPYYQEYPRTVNVYAFNEPQQAEDSLQQAHLDKIQDPEMRAKAKNEF